MLIWTQEERWIPFKKFSSAPTEDLKKIGRSGVDAINKWNHEHNLAMEAAKVFGRAPNFKPKSMLPYPDWCK